jgi:hypothetical protein
LIQQAYDAGINNPVMDARAVPDVTENPLIDESLKLV